jgi:hypothetical protein
LTNYPSLQTGKYFLVRDYFPQVHRFIGYQ